MKNIKKMQVSKAIIDFKEKELEDVYVSTYITKHDKNDMLIYCKMEKIKKKDIWK